MLKDKLIRLENMFCVSVSYNNTFRGVSSPDSWKIQNYASLYKAETIYVTFSHLCVKDFCCCLANNDSVGADPEHFEPGAQIRKKQGAEPGPPVFSI